MRCISTFAVLCGGVVLLTAGCGDKTASGGTAGTTGAAGMTGAAGTNGAAGTTGAAGTNGGTAGTTGAGGAVSCTFTQSSSVSTMIPTVGIITWSTTLSGVQSAKIDFGLTTSYGMTAPVDLAQQNYRTLLLGMKGSRMYHYRITATSGGGQCASPDYTIMTGPIANGLVKPTVTTNNAAALSGGFILTGQYVQNVGGSAPAYILDSDGDYVWWFNIENYVTGVVMDYAGTHMWINNHPPNLADAKVHRVTMDGLTAQDLSSQFVELSHQLTVLPDETVAFYAADSGTQGCSDIKEWKNGSVRTIANS